jgi:hypothetical protein
MSLRRENRPLGYQARSMKAGAAQVGCHRRRTAGRLKREHRARAELIAEFVAYPGAFDDPGLECGMCQGDGREPCGGCVADCTCAGWTLELCELCGGTGDGREVAVLAVIRGEIFDPDAAAVIADGLTASRSRGLACDRRQVSDNAASDAAQGLALQLVLAQHVDLVHGPHDRYTRRGVRARLRPLELPSLLRWVSARWNDPPPLAMAFALIVDATIALE